MEGVLNRHGIWVKKGCCSCAHKRELRSFSTRYCEKLRKRVKANGLCEEWEMSALLSTLKIKN